MVVGVPCAKVGMVVVGSERACCEVSASRGAFGCAGAPGRIVTCAWDVSFVSFARPWDTGVSITGTVSGDNPCGPSVCDAIVLRPALGLS